MAATQEPARDRPAPSPAPAAGVLEEIDGTPIASDPGGGAAGRGVMPLTGVRRAFGLALGRPALWVYALLAFLARGGLVLMVAPIVALPTFIGIANMVGPTSVTAAGPTARLTLILVVATAVVVVATVAGTLLAAAAEAALYRHTTAADPDDTSSALHDAPPASRRVVLQVAVARLALLAPVVAAVAYGISEYVAVGYRELVLPSSLAVPLPVRVLLGAPGPTILVLIAWLGGEIVGGLAARRIVLLRANSLRAIGGALVDVAAAPLTHLGLLALGIVISAALLLPGLAGSGFAWEFARVALVDGRDGLAALLGTMLVAGTWCLALALAGVAAALRSALVTIVATRRYRPLGTPNPGSPA